MCFCLLFYKIIKMHGTCIKIKVVFKFHRIDMLEKLIQTQIREISSLLHIVVLCTIASWNNAIFLIRYAYIPTWHASLLFPFVNIAFIFPYTRRRGKKKNYDSEKYPLATLGLWELKRVCIDVLDFGRSPMFFFFHLSAQKTEELFRTNGMPSRSFYHLTFCCKFRMLQNPGNSD